MRNVRSSSAGMIRCVEWMEIAGIVESHFRLHLRAILGLLHRTPLLLQAESYVRGMERGG